MRAAILRQGEIVVDDVPEPTPGPGQVLVETLACGICGSDLHCRLHAEELVASSKACGMAIFDFDTKRDLVMGHEFSARVLDLGTDVSNVSPGDIIVCHPVMFTPAGARSIGYSNDFPGGYGERMVLDASRAVAVPDGLDPRLAAMTEPMAVGLHAVNASWVDQTKSAIVLGCGPVGLAIIAALTMRGVPLVVAADFSPARRTFATQLGAHVVVDPSEIEAVTAWRQAGGRGRTVIIDAIGVPGIIESAMMAAPRRSQILVVGVCMQTDRFWPAVGINKELTVSFVLGWNPEEFRECLESIAEGRLAVEALVTGDVELDEVADAFDQLARPDRHVKILVRPNGR